MFKITPFIAVVSMLLIPNAASAFQQQANVKIVPTSGKGTPKGKGYVKLDSYLSTRDPNSTRGTMKANPVGTVNMAFPPGSSINKTATGSVCQQSEYSTIATLASLCSKSVVGTGWALLNSGSPVPQTQIPGAPPACDINDSTQYSRTWEKNPDVGPDCVPVGDIYTKVTAYQGGILGNKYWCYGMDQYTITIPSGKACYFKDSKGRTFNYSNLGLNAKYNASLNACNIIFANDNGVAPLAFGGTVNNCQNELAVIIPALGGKGSGLGELTGGVVLSDFRLKITNTKYLKSGPCVRKKFVVKTHFTYSKLLGEDSLPASNPATQDVTYNSSCK